MSRFWELYYQGRDCDGLRTNFQAGWFAAWWFSSRRSRMGHQNATTDRWWVSERSLSWWARVRAQAQADSRSVAPPRAWSIWKVKPSKCTYKILGFKLKEVRTLLHSVHRILATKPPTLPYPKKDQYSGFSLPFLPRSRALERQACWVLPPRKAGSRRFRWFDPKTRRGGNEPYVRKVVRCQGKNYYIVLISYLTFKIGWIILSLNCFEMVIFDEWNDPGDKTHNRIKKLNN